MYWEVTRTLLGGCDSSHLSICSNTDISPSNTENNVVIPNHNVHNCMFKGLTISGHADRDALLKSTVLTAIAVHPHDLTVFILHTHLIMDVLLDTAAEETLRRTQDQSECVCVPSVSVIHSEGIL